MAFSAGGDGVVDPLDLASSHHEDRGGTGERLAYGQDDDHAHGYAATRATSHRNSWAGDIAQMKLVNRCSVIVRPRAFSVSDLVVSALSKQTQVCLIFVCALETCGLSFVVEY